MDFEQSEEHRMIQGAVRRFIEEELLPIEMKVPAGPWLPDEYQEPLVRKTKALGLWALEAASQYGGGDLNAVGSAMLHEEEAKCTAGRAVFGSPGPVHLYGASPHLVEQYLLPAIRGEQRYFFGLTEPHTGADPASLKTRAVRDGDHYVLNGSKTFNSFVDQSQWGTIFASTNPERGRAGISCFVVETNSPGFKIIRRIPTIHTWLTSFELAFDDVRVPAENLVGEEGQGFALGQRWLNRNRLLFGPQTVGMADRLIKMSASYAKLRVTFGQPIAARQAIQWMLADAWIEAYAMRTMSYHAAWKFDQGEECRQEMAAIKSFCGDVAFRIADRAMQIHGAVGTSTDLPIERYWRETRHLRIGEGSQEMMKFVIARNILRD